ncbi:MAG: hypothetical protein Q4E21_04360 [Clostridia bacterium]|nr:hypothetical protein [Clostridia bacterium]
MSNLEIFITNPFSISSTSFYPRNYNPDFLFVRDELQNNPTLTEYIEGDVKGGSTPPAYLFYKDKGVPFIKTSAVSRHFINTNDLHLINSNFHNNSLKRSITKPYDIIYTMTGKFMGKAALCPPTINEMNMSQNSVVLHTDTPEKAAFLTIFLNSRINRIQVRGSYSITKQKFLNQGKISALRVMPYHKRYDFIMQQYISAFNTYYQSVAKIQSIIGLFNKNYKLPYSDTPQFGFIVKPARFSKNMLTPNFYRDDVAETIDIIKEIGGNATFDKANLSKGDEIGSAFYQEEGVPFIKTSDIMNYDIDHEPDCYCSESFLSQLEQNIKIGDILFAKDGKPGEVAIVLEDKKAVISSGLVKYHPRTEKEGYWSFLLLSSQYGNAYFKKWFVIASTMLHLRADFFDDFKIPKITPEIEEIYLAPLKDAFLAKSTAYKQIVKIKNLVEESYTNDDVDLTLV